MQSNRMGLTVFVGEGVDDCCGVAVEDSVLDEALFPSESTPKVRVPTMRVVDKTKNVALPLMRTV